MKKIIILSALIILFIGTLNVTSAALTTDNVGFKNSEVTERFGDYKGWTKFSSTWFTVTDVMKFKKKFTNPDTPYMGYAKIKCVHKDDRIKSVKLRVYVGYKGVKYKTYNFKKPKKSVTIKLGKNTHLDTFQEGSYNKNIAKIKHNKLYI